MKIKSLFIIAIFSLAASVQALAQSSETAAEHSAVRVPLENYIRAHAAGDGRDLGRSFHPEAKIQGIKPDDGKLVSFKFEDYVKTFPGKPAADEAARRRRIESIEITKNAAVAKLVFDYPAVKITDYLLLLKIDGEWKIVNKIAQGEPRGPVRKN
jgi:hypothetical protein